MNRATLLLLGCRANMALQRAESSDGLRRVWETYREPLGHRRLGNIMLGPTVMRRQRPGPRSPSAIRRARKTAVTDAAAALSSAATAEDVRIVWSTFGPTVGYYMLGRLLIGSRPSSLDEVSNSPPSEDVPPGRSSRARRVLLALRQIGAPAHYSAIADQYNQMFPDDPATEGQVHSVLRHRSYGIVWTGMRGVYGLTELGHRRPSRSLFDAVADIVKAAYAATARPVPFAVIAAELAKDRTVLNLNSVRIAVRRNPAVRRLAGHLFAPSDPDDTEPARARPRLDEILAEFESRGR